ncbi:ATP-dependent DNA helicase UvrD/PcrA [Patulibacter medicamentivorans]|uniref:DNA 3'-5' helicase n=1 Tax=Patulibacter medicamentivorans TaxID=1097667 RepID=H0E0Z0_9ACTN|nr:UvrD-helicase domain-containing protein [Patulibacter medicamentivorans]EHN12651.1 ATP-dependent DNA helicase UvrD/PcrA [Patulibacter medicamentivorans]
MPSVDAYAAELLEGLNEPQREAVTHEGGPLLVIAGAGSGKTRVLTHRVAWLVRTGQVGLGEILAVTFTNKAAAELRHRVGDLLGRSTRGLWVSTFHSSCARILRVEAERLGYSRQFTIYDSDDAKRLLKRVLDSQGADTKRFTPGSVHNRISDHKNRLRSVEQAAEQAAGFYDRTVVDAYRGYQQALVANNAMDFDDLMGRTVDLFERFPEVRERYRNAFKHVLVDEYQDTNPAQYRFLQLLCMDDPMHLDPDDEFGPLAGEEPGHRNLMVVGDDAQSIYGFRSADIRNILDFEDDFPDAKVVRLEQNYRSTQHILDAANGLIEHNANQRKKHLWTDLGAGDPVRVRALPDDHAESRWVVAEIERLAGEGAPLGEMAVLYRTNALSRAIETALTGAELGYQVIGGVRFFDRAEVKDVLAYLAWLLNPANTVAFARIVNRPKRGIGDTTVGRLLAHASTLGVTPLQVLDDPAAAGLKTAAIRSVGAFAEQVHELREAVLAGSTIADLVEAILRVTGYRAELEASNDPQDEGRLENLEQLHAYADEFDHEDASAEPDDERASLRPLDRFLQQTALLSDADQKGDHPDGTVTLMTLHNAKGLEFDSVFLIGCEDGVFPHSRAIDAGELEEERRLAYVGLTRARRHLSLTWARRRGLYGPPQSQVPSRFLRELPVEALDESSPEALSGGVQAVPRPRYDAGRIGRVGGGGGGSTSGRTLAELGLRRGSELGSAGRAAAGGAGDEAPDVVVGQRVRHGKFGEGDVVTVDDNVIVVDFDEHGERRLIAGFARLEPV